MIEPVIAAINLRIAELNIFPDIRGLCKMITETGNDNEKRFPAEYKAKDELRHVAGNDYQNGVIFHIPRAPWNLEYLAESIIATSRYLQMTYPMSLVAMIRKSIYKRDNAYSETELVENLTSKVSVRQFSDLRAVLNVNNVGSTVTNKIIDVEDILSRYFIGIELEYRHDLSVIEIEYDIVMRGNEKCFETYNC